MSGPVAHDASATRMPPQQTLTKDEPDTTRRSRAIHTINDTRDHDARQIDADRSPDKASLRGPGLARHGSIMRTPGSGIPTPRAAVRPKSTAETMPPPTLIGRAQSLRKPLVSTSHERPVAQRPLPSPNSSMMASKAISQPSVSGASGGLLRRSASSRIPGSTTLGAQSSKDVSKPVARLHGRTQSTSVKVGGQRQGAESVHTASLSTTHARSKSTASGIDSGRSLEPTESSTHNSPSVGSRMISKGAKSTIAMPHNASVTRPAFSTLQQHFSPAKSVSKPPLPSSRLGPSSEDILASAGATFETSKTQAELLYLSLLHQAAEPTLKAFEQSAQASLRKTYASLQTQRALIRTAERSYRERLNLNALAAWTRASNNDFGNTNHVLTDSVRSLSLCYNELVELSEEGGRHSSVIKEFSEWIARATDTITTGTTMKGDVFVGALPQDWHEATTSLLQRLRLLQREVERLPRFPAHLASEYGGSTVVGLLQYLEALPTSMLKGLESMLDIEKQVLVREVQRVENVLSGIDVEALEGLSTQPATWHT